MRPGERLGAFVIERRLGTDAQGEAFAAEHPELRRKVRIKIVAHATAADEERLRLVSRLAHPHLVDLFDLGRTPDGRLYYVTELLEGRTLASALPLPAADIIAILIDVCSALEAAEAQRLRHGNLSTETLQLIERPGEPPFVKLVDLGLAPRTDDARALGAILLPLASTAPLQAIAQRATADNPDEGYPTIRALRDDLQRVQRGEPPAQKLDPAAPTMMFRASDVLRPPPPAAPVVPAAAPPTASELKTAPLPGGSPRPAVSGKRVTTIFLGLVILVAGAAFTIFTLRKNHPKTKAAMQAPPSLAALRSQALAAITTALGDGDPAIRKQAIELLAATRDARHAGLVEPRLKDADTSVRAAAATALGQLGARDATAALRSAETGRDNVAAHEALMLLGAAEGEAKLKQLVSSPDETVRGAAAIALGTREPRALAELEKQVATPTVDEAQRLRALGALCAAAARWKDELVKLIDQSQPALQVRALEPLATCDADLARARIKPLAAEGSTVRVGALRLLALLDDHSGYDVALQRLVDGATPLADRLVAADAVGLSGEKGALTRLAPLLTADDPTLRTATAGAVLTILSRDPHALASRSLSWAASALTNQSPALREQAALVLGDANAQLAIPLLGRAIRDPEVGVRRAAASSLGRTKSGAAAGLLDNALSDDKPEVRQTVIRSLGKLPQEASAPVLRRHVQRAAPSERVLAAGQLVRFGDREALGTIRVALGEQDPEVRRAALEVAEAAPELVAEATKAGLADKDPNVRFAAALLAAQQKDKAALPVLTEALARGGIDALRAYVAIHALGADVPGKVDPSAMLDGMPNGAKREAMAIAQRLPLAKALIVWRRGLKDADATVRMAALEAIGDSASDDAGAMIFVRAALSDGDAGVRAKAGAILGRLAPPLKAGEEPVEPEPTTASLAVDLGAPASAPDLLATLAAPDLQPAASPDLAPPPGDKPTTPETDPKEEARLAMTAGEVALRTGKIETAISELERARKLNPKLPLYFSLGEAYRKRGDLESDASKQRQAYQRAIEHYQKSKDKRGAAYAAELTERLGEK